FSELRSIADKLLIPPVPTKAQIEQAVDMANFLQQNIFNVPENLGEAWAEVVNKAGTLLRLVFASVEEARAHNATCHEPYTSALQQMSQTLAQERSLARLAFTSDIEEADSKVLLLRL